MIDRLQRRTPGSGMCELCEKKPATRKAKFKAQYLESLSTPLAEEESLRSMDVQKRVCEGCLDSLRIAKNVTELIFERL